MTFVKVLNQCLKVIFVTLGQMVGCLKLNDLMGKLKDEFIEAESTIFTVQEIANATGLLKVGKAAGCKDIKYAHPLIICLLQLLFNTSCEHG